MGRHQGDVQVEQTHAIWTTQAQLPVPLRRSRSTYSPNGISLESGSRGNADQNFEQSITNLYLTSPLTARS